MANEDSELAYIDRKQKVVADSKCATLDEEFMPMMVTELMYRQKQVQDIAESGEIMPRKTTYFYPKAITGLALNKLY